MSRLPEVLPDSLLVQRMAALSDRTALAELDARHGMTLYALAYALLFDGEAADVAVAMAVRGAWRSAAAFDVRAGSVVQWLPGRAGPAGGARAGPPPNTEPPPREGAGAPKGENPPPERA